MKYDNFYETVAEATMRLRHTIIYYHGPGEEGPYYVLAVTDHLGDGKFRIYMKALGQKYIPDPSIIPPSEQVSSSSPSLGDHMDKFMKTYPKFGLVRKELTSPHFKAFRPFPLGMMNSVSRDKEGKIVDCDTLYLERQPNRKSEQGLTRSMVYISPVTAAMKRAPSPAGYNFDLWSPEFRDSIMGDYPDIETCLSKLRDPKIDNEAAAFHRHFALVRGPIDMLFLSYKGEIVGMLPNNNLSQVTIGREHRYTREAVCDLKVFNSVQGR